MMNVGNINKTVGNWGKDFILLRLAGKYQGEMGEIPYEV